MKRIIEHQNILSTKGYNGKDDDKNKYQNILEQYFGN